MNSLSYRQITFGAYSSFDDFGVYIGSEVDTDTKIERAKPRTLRETIPFMSGSYNFSRLGGKIVYNDRVIRYTFIVSGISRADVEAKIIALDGWLGDVTETELIDTDFPGWKFINVSYTGMGVPQFYSNNEASARVTADFTAGPYMQSASGMLVNCLDIIPNSESTKYLFTSWAAPAHMAQARYYLSRLTSPGSGVMPGMTISYSTTSGMKSAVVTITAASSSPSYLLMPKVMSSVTITPTQTSGLGLVKEDSDYYYYSRASGVQAVIYLSGFNYSTYSESQVTEIIKHASWQYPDNQQSFPTSNIPNTSHMRVISEGDPTILINNTAVDASSFELSTYDIVSINNSKSVTCKLQFCTIQEQR